MTHFRVDLRTKIIAAGTRIYLARAGKQGHLFQQVVEAQAIGPDLPDLNLNLRNGLDGDADLEAKVKRSRTLSQWLRRPEAHRGDPPSRNLADYRGAPARAGHAQIEGIVRGYFQEIKAGDILVIPNPSIFGEAIVAEALSLGVAPARIEGVGRFDGHQFDGRRFGHFTRVKMASLPRAVVDLAKAPTGLAEIINPLVKRRIFELTYPDYVLDEEFSAQIVTTKDDFKPLDGNVLNALVTMVAANVEALQHGADHPHMVGLVDAAFMKLPDQDLQVKIDINSPGHLAIIARSIVPLVTAAVLGVLVSVGFDAQAVTPDTVVEVVNSRAAELNDVCSQEVERLTQSMLRFLAAEPEFQRTCDLLRETHESTGAQSNVTVEVE